MFSLNGIRQMSEEFEFAGALTPAGLPAGLSVVGNRVYVANTVVQGDGLIVFDLDGNRQMSEEFAFPLRSALALSVVGNRVYVANSDIVSRLLVFDLDGNRQMSEEFNLSGGHLTVQGLSVVGNRVYYTRAVVGQTPRVVVTDLSGNDQASEGFDLPVAPGVVSVAGGLSVVGNRAYVLDR